MAEDDFSLGEGEAKVAFNRSVEITRDITFLRRSYFSAFFSGNLTEQFKALTMIKGIIRTKLKPDERIEIDEFENQLWKDIQIAEQQHAFKGNMVFKYGNMRADVEARLKEYSEVLYELENKYGFGMSDMNDPRHALING